MNLWVKRVALGLMAAAALVLFACLEEENILGFKNQNQKFKVSSVEIPIESSILLFDSLRTSNYDSDPIKRLLVGRCVDPVFGTIEAEAYTQLKPTAIARVKPLGAMFDSVLLTLTFDLYHYGTSTSSIETYEVHEVSEVLTHQGGNDYYSFTSVPYEAEVLGEGGLILSANRLDSMVSRNDTTVSITVPLSNTYGQKLFDFWDTNNKDYTDFHEFRKVVKGLAIVGSGNEKVVGFSPGSSRVTIYYHTDTTALSYNFDMIKVVSGSKISTERSSSDLSGLEVAYQDFIPANANKRYIQSGTPVGVKLDVSAFENAFKDIENARIISAELSIEAIDNPTGYKPPNALFIQVLDEFNQLKEYSLSAQDTFDIKSYQNRATAITDTALIDCSRRFLQSTSFINREDVITVVSDTQCDFAQLSYNSSQKSYKGFITFFAQELYEDESKTVNGVTYEKTKFYDLVLYPGNPHAAKSVNRVSFNKDQLKLKIFYTTPITEE
jgi:hypothetical protein